MTLTMSITHLSAQDSTTQLQTAMDKQHTEMSLASDNTINGVVFATSSVLLYACGHSIYKPEYTSPVDIIAGALMAGSIYCIVNANVHIKRANKISIAVGPNRVLFAYKL